MIQPSEAAKSFEAALKRNPDFVQAHLNLAMTYQWYLPGNDAKALEAFQQYLQLTREPAPGVQALADALQIKVRPNPAPVSHRRDQPIDGGVVAARHQCGHHQSGH